ncbi:MAG: hypothetical protein KF799_07130 [Bdellovibrionales bacterium]|nr:hypothetical protein [Bdellovibrionales bacterium]
MRSVFLSALLLCACVSTHLPIESRIPYPRPADFQDHLDYYAFGLIGTASVDLQRVCMERKPQAAEKIRTFEDAVITLATLGVYAPLTVRVWCE